MKNPKQIETITPGAHYKVPVYAIDDAGIYNPVEMDVKFCKGSKEDPTVFRQMGLFTETLIQVVKQYLEDVNVGDLSSRETSMAITKLDEALMWLNKRAEDRKLRGVQATYNK